MSCRTFMVGAALACAAPASAQLVLTPAGSLDITALDLDAPAGLAYDGDLGRLWITDGGFGNTVTELDPLTGIALSQFPADVVPGLTAGPDAIALHTGTGALYISSAFAFGLEEGLVDTSGVLVNDWATQNRASGATGTDTGELWAYSFATGRLVELDPSSGATLQDFASPALLTALAFDPQTRNLYGLSVSNLLYELDPASGATLSVTDLTPLGLPSYFPAGMTFNGTGTQLYITKDPLGDTISVFDRQGAVGSSYCSPAVPNSTGGPGVIFAFGDGVAGGALELRMQSLPPNQFGYFLCSRVQDFTPLAGGSQGDLCLGLPIGRFQAQLASSGAGGVIVVQVDTLALPLTPPVAAQAGESWSFQGWYRDVNPGNTSNFTDAVEVVFQ